MSATITDGDHNTPQFSDEGVRFIFVGNVSSARLHFENGKRVSADYFKTLKPQRLAERVDILYSAVGATLGVPAVVNTNEPFCFQRHVAILKPNHKLVESQFVWHMLGSRTVFEKAWASTTGLAQPTGPLRAIRELPIPIPPLPEQRGIVTDLDALQAQVDALRKLQSKTASELDALLPSILRQSVQGRIVDGGESMKNQNASNLCLFCGSAATSFTKSQHIIPESLGNTSFVLREVVCDNCNQYFSKLENYFIHHHLSSPHRLLSIDKTKKGKPPMQTLVDGELRRQHDGKLNFRQPILEGREHEQLTSHPLLMK